MGIDYEPRHGELVYLTYRRNNKSIEARAIHYKGRYLGIRLFMARPNDATVKLYHIDEFTVEEVEPLTEQDHGPTGIEKAVRIAMLNNEKEAKVTLRIKPK